MHMLNLNIYEILVKTLNNFSSDSYIMDKALWVLSNIAIDSDKSNRLFFETQTFRKVAQFLNSINNISVASEAVITLSL